MISYCESEHAFGQRKKFILKKKFTLNREEFKHQYVINSNELLMYFIVIIYNAYFINYVCIYAVSLYAVYTCKRAGKPRFRSRYRIPRISSVRRTKSAVFQREFGQSRAVSAAFNLKLNSHRRRLHRRRALECSS